VRFAVPELPKRWKLQRSMDGLATLEAPSSALGKLTPAVIISSALSFLVYAPAFLLVCSFYLFQLWQGREIWHFSATGIRIRSTLLGITWRTRAFANRTLSVAQRSGGFWELRLHEPGDYSTRYRSDKLPEVLALAAFLAEELGWREDQPDVVPPCFRPALNLAWMESDDTRLRLLLADPRCVPVVMQAWLEASPVMRIRIKSKLAAIEPEASWLTKAVEAGPAASQSLVIEILSGLGEPRILPALRRLLAGPPGEARTQAVVALGQMRDTEVVPVLCEALRFEPGLWFAAVAALGMIGDSRAVPPLSELLNDLVQGNEADLRQQIVVALGKLRDPAAIPALANALHDPDVNVRASAVDALGKSGRAEAVLPLLQAFLDRSPEVAGKAVTALGIIRDPRAVEPLTYALRSGAPELRVRLVQALAEIGGAVVVPVLCRSLDDPNGRVAREAALGLARLARSSPTLPIQLRSALPHLKRLGGTFSNETPEVKRACGDAIRWIEAGTGSIKQLPLPAETEPLHPHTLPLPASDSEQLARSGALNPQLNAADGDLQELTGSQG